MSSRRQIVAKRDAYGDVRTMLSAMKSIALMELHKLSDQIERQRAALETAERAAADFLAFHDLPLETGKTICIVIGSERGFCGDFNDELLPAIKTIRERGDQMLLIGSRLAERFEEEQDKPETLPGPNIAEEIPPALESVTRRLEEIQSTAPQVTLRVTALFHDKDGPDEKVIAPLPLPKDKLEMRPCPPYLTMQPQVFLAGLMEQAMLLALHEVFALSLEIENRRRLEHMDNALRRLDEITADMERRINQARQADIIQEIEMITLSGDTPETL